MRYIIAIFTLEIFQGVITVCRNYQNKHIQYCISKIAMLYGVLL